MLLTKSKLDMEQIYWNNDLFKFNSHCTRVKHARERQSYMCYWHWTNQFPVKVDLNDQCILILSNEHVEICRNVKLKFQIIYRLLSTIKIWKKLECKPEWYTGYNWPYQKWEEPYVNIIIGTLIAKFGRPLY